MPRPVQCRVCGRSEVGTLLAEVNALGMTNLPVVKCHGCGSLEITASPRESSPDDASIDGYVEAGAGIDTIAEGLAAVDPAAVRRFLDVGCNYGFALDLGRFLFDWETVGVEPSLAGSRGRTELGLDIRSEYLTDGSDVGEFDLILASEVLEHVTEPLEFLRLLARRLRPSGTIVLTTPAAEIVSPDSVLGEALVALSPGFHVFLASCAGLEGLLRSAGFQSVQVVRRGGSLRAAASLGANAAVGWDESRGVGADRLVAYFDSRADSAEPGSALASGMATRHLRALVSRGQFDDVAPSIQRVQDAFAGRHDLDLADPVAAIRALRARQVAPWNLGGVAFALGMCDLLHHGVPARAASYFELATTSIDLWLRSAEIADLDTEDLRFQAPVHRALALAQVEPAAAADAAIGLRSFVDGEGGHRTVQVALCQCRVFVELVARGHYDEAAKLEGIASSEVEELAASSEEAARLAGLDGMYSLGIVALVRGDHADAFGWFDACARLCAVRPESDGHAANLAVVAREHADLAATNLADLPESRAARVTSEQVRVHHGIDVYWCDASGTFIEGWAHAESHRLDRITVEVGDQRQTVAVRPRPDLASFWPGIPEVTSSGFSAYVEGSPHGAAALILHTAVGDHRIELALPAGPVPDVEPFGESAEWQEMRDFVELAPEGPVVTVGMRSSSPSILDARMAPFRGRRVVNVDIHPGLGVDVVGDAHRLSRFLAHDHFAVAASASLLEHVAAPWLVAAELARVLRPGGLAMPRGAVGVSDSRGTERLLALLRRGARPAVRPGRRLRSGRDGPGRWRDRASAARLARRCPEDGDDVVGGQLVDRRAKGRRPV